LAKVQSGYVNFTPYYGGVGVSRFASVKFIDDSEGEYGDAFDAFLPVPSGQHPALFPGDILAVADPCRGGIGVVTPTPHAWTGPVCISPCAGAEYGTIQAYTGRLPGPVPILPKGWKLCDGENGTIDLRGRFIMGIDVGGIAGENTMGATGGFRKHGTTENNHNDHPHHGHPVTASSSFCTDETGEGNFVAPYDAYSAGNDTADWSHSDSDNRPRYYVLAFMQRVE
jgi:hypothetical protein